MSLFDKRTKKEKLWDNARNLIEKKEWVSALEALRKIIEIDAKDARVLLKLGEIYQKIDDKANAIVYFLKAAEEYSKDGFYPKAIAVLKQVLALDPNRLDVRENMALLYENDKINLPEEAEAQRVFIRAADVGKEKAVLDFIKDKYATAGKGDARALEFCKNLCIVVLESTEAQIRERLDARILPAKPQPKKKSPKKRKK